MTTNTVLITGGSGAVGQILLENFLRRGTRVVFTAASETSLQQTLKKFSHFENLLTGILYSHSNSSDVDLFVNEVVNRNISINSLVNNARSRASLLMDEYGETSDESFLSEFIVNVVFPYRLTTRLTKCCPNTLRSVVNIGSVYGVSVPNPALYKGGIKESPVQYGVTKAALHQLTKELAVRLSKQKIRVNCVAFGGLRGRVDSDFERRYSKLNPSDRMLDHSDIFGPVEFLTSEASSAVNGHVLMADGGWTLW